MLFHSLEFAVFFPIVFGLYLCLPHIWQNRMLLVASYIFYGAWDWRYVSLLLVSTVADFFCGRCIERTDNVNVKKRFVALSVVANLGMLCTFKYYDFFAENFQVMMGTVGLEVHPYFLDVALPIGISFFTFQTMSYTIDVYRGKVAAAKNIFDFSLYVSFFPQLIAGPIERGTRLLPQILAPRVVTPEKVYRGAYLVLWGLFLKVFIADNLTELVDPVFAEGPYDGASVLIATYAFSIQIYCDFAGYSFMAMGLAGAMGIELMENFRRPYFAKNIAEFWRRWHISLSSWFRDYVFTPYYVHVEKWRILRGLKLKSRHAAAFFITLFVTEVLLGLWHGAGWNYVFFGVFHALVIGAYYYLRKYWDRMPLGLQIFCMYQIASLGWLVFRANSLGQAWEMFLSIFNNFQLVSPHYDLVTAVMTLAAISGILVIVQVFQELKNNTFVVLRWPRMVRYGFFTALIALVAFFGNFGVKPFIYFQF